MNALLKRKRQTDPGKRFHVAPVKRKAAVLSAMLSPAIRWNLLSANPMERVQIKAPDTPEDEKIVFFSQPEAERFLEALENPAYYTAFRRLARPLSTPQRSASMILRANRRSMTQYKFLFYLAIFTAAGAGNLSPPHGDDLDFTNATISIVKKRVAVKKKSSQEYQNKNLPALSHFRRSLSPLAQEWKKEQAYYRLSLIGSPMEKRWIYLYPLEWGNDGT